MEKSEPIEVFTLSRSPLEMHPRFLRFGKSVLQYEDATSLAFKHQKRLTTVNFAPSMFDDMFIIMIGTAFGELKLKSSVRSWSGYETSKTRANSEAFVEIMRLLKARILPFIIKQLFDTFLVRSKITVAGFQLEERGITTNVQNLFRPRILKIPWTEYHSCQELFDNISIHRAGDQTPILFASCSINEPNAIALPMILPLICNTLYERRVGRFASSR